MASTPAAAISRAPSGHGSKGKVSVPTPSAAIAGAAGISRRGIAAGAGVCNHPSRKEQTGGTPTSGGTCTGATRGACTSIAFRARIATCVSRLAPRPGAPAAVITRPVSSTGGASPTRPGPDVRRASVAARRPSSTVGFTSREAAPVVSTAPVLTGMVRQGFTSKAAVFTAARFASTPLKPSTILLTCIIGPIITPCTH